MHSHVCKNETCGKTFSSNKKRRSFCSDCNEAANNNTARQYAMVNGNLRMFLNRLRSKNNHIPSKSRKNITLEHLLNLWKIQDGLCDETGISMTCRLAKGEWFPWNVSIDRIKAGEPYTLDNIRLVCSGTNGLMRQLSKEVFRKTCIAVADKLRQRLPTPMSHPWINSVVKPHDAFASFPRRVPLTGISELAAGIDMSKEYQIAAHLAELDYLAHEIAVKRAIAMAA